MKTLLIPVNFSGSSENIIQYAADFSCDTHVERIILLKSFYVSVYTQLLPSADFVQVSAEEIDEQRQQEVDKLKTLGHQLLKKCLPTIKIKTAISELPLLRAVHNVLVEEQADVVMIGTDKVLYENDAYISEQIIAIAKTSTRPVMIIPNHIRYKKIEEAVVPCDFAAISRLNAFKTYRDPAKWLHPKLLLLNVDAKQKHHEDDHTGNTGGYMMVVNASVSKTDYFYKREVDNLCGGTTYQFSAWIGNLLRYSDLSPPDIIFSIETTSGTVIQSYDTGLVTQRTSGFKWIQYAFNFTLPANTQNVIIKMTNNANGGAPANDLALDDITFRPYGPSLVAGFGASTTGTSITECAGQTKSYTLSATAPTGYTNPAYQWQVNTGSGWKDISGATKLSYTASPTTVGTYEYRLATAESTNISSESCRVVSNVLTITVDSAPTVTASSNTPVCTGNTLSLTASSGTTYSWTGPNGFTSTQQNPTISNITTAAAGDYKVTVTTGNCSASATTTVNVYAQPTANAGSDVTICEGDNTTLSASGGTGYSWSPTTGLSDPNIANPVASPTDTTTYTVTVSNSNACTATASVTVNVLQKPVAKATAYEEITQGQSVTLNGTAKGTAVTYYWTPNEYLSSDIVLHPVATPPEDITYTLHVVSGVGCGSEATADVFVRVYKAITIPNTFTPNSDGINDTWNITALDTYPESVTQVFDRYGGIVFKSIGYTKAWDGTYDNKRVATGTYYYIIDLKNGKKFSGWVLVVR